GRGVAAPRGAAAGHPLEHRRPHGDAAGGFDREAEFAVAPRGNDPAEDGRLLGRTAADDGSIRRALPDARDRHPTFPVYEIGRTWTPYPAVRGGPADRRAIRPADEQPAVRLPSRERRCGRRYGRRNPGRDDRATQDHTSLHEDASV